MAENKTKPTGADVDAFIDAVDSDRRREEARTVLTLMREVTGEEPAMWGPSMVGFGSVHYQGKSGEAYGPCAIFPGFDVNAKGWCAGFQAKS